jgi:hypothetical protein
MLFMPSSTKSKDTESSGSRFRQKLGEKIIALGTMISGVREARGIEVEGKSLRFVRRSGSVKVKSDGAGGAAGGEEKHHRRRRTHRRHGDDVEEEVQSKIVEKEQPVNSIKSHRVSRSNKDRGVQFDVRPITPASDVGSQEQSLFVSTKDSMEEVMRKDAEDRLRLEEQRRQEEERLAREKQLEQERLLQAQERASKLQRRKQEEEQKGREKSRRRERGREEERIRREEAAQIQQNERKQQEVERQRHLKAVRFQEEQENQKRKSQSVFPPGLTSFFFKQSEDDKEKETEEEEEEEEEEDEDRNVGDMQRTVLEGMIRTTSDEGRRKQGRESVQLTARNLARSRAERDDDGDEWEDDRCVGDMQRTYVEGVYSAGGRG